MKNKIGMILTLGISLLLTSQIDAQILKQQCDNGDCELYLPLVLRSIDPETIVFSSDRNGLSNVFVMNSLGIGQQSLTNYTEGLGAFVPSLSPDGSQIAFMSNHENPSLPGGNGFEIYVMNVDGSNLTRLTFNAVVDQSPAWSPDGTKIVFVSNRGSTMGVFGIYVMNNDGSNVETLTLDGNSPSWSPDGTKIAYMAIDNSTGNPEIFLMNSDGSNSVPLTTIGGNSPDWSPDGTKIAFSSSSDGDSEIYFINPDGSNLQQLTFNDSGDSSPAWLPNGIQIVFESNRDGNEEVYLMELDGTSQVNLTNYPGRDWAPDG